MPNRKFTDLNRQEHLDLLQTMYLIRYFEEVAGQFYRKGLVKGGIHASIGQEAAEVGICAQLKKEDYITSTHRGHGHHIAKGADINRLMAEILGRVDGYCKGRGGSMHVAAFDVGSLGAFPIVAAGLPSGVGAALSAQLLDKSYKVASFFGDGALGQGTVYECLNLAAVWKLPMLFVCENNQYAVSTNCKFTIAFTEIAEMAKSHGFFSLKVDGQYLDQVYDCASDAVAHIEAEGGPVFIQTETYRFEGHYFGEPEVNRDRETVKKIRLERDPLLLFIQWLEARYGAGIQDDVQTVQQQAKGKIEAAKQFALASAVPDPAGFKEYVYA